MEKVQFKKADPKAPRFRPENFDILNRDNRKFYADMKKQYPQLTKYRNSDIANCIKLFNVRIASEVVRNRNGVKLPDGLGIVVVGACKVSEVYKPDYNVSDKLGVSVPYQNAHSDSYIAQIKYTNELDQHMFDNHDLWMFDPCRNLMRAVSAEFKAGNHTRYIVFDTYEHIAHLFRKTKIHKDDGSADRKKTKRLEEYDEFAFN